MVFHLDDTEVFRDGGRSSRRAHRGAAGSTGAPSKSRECPLPDSFLSPVPAVDFLTASRIAVNLRRYIDPNISVRRRTVHLITSQEVLVPLLLTLKVAGWATLLATLAGVADRVCLARLRFPGREMLDAMMTLPMVMPPTVLGYYLLVLVGRRGADRRMARGQSRHFARVYLAGRGDRAAVVAFPLVYKAARAAFEGVERQFEQAARVLGKSEFAVFIQGHAAAGLARHPRRRDARLCARHGRIRRNADGRRQSSGAHPDAVDRGIRSRPGGKGRCRQFPGDRDFDRLHRHPAGIGTAAAPPIRMA